MSYNVKLDDVKNILIRLRDILTNLGDMEVLFTASHVTEYIPTISSIPLNSMERCTTNPMEKRGTEDEGMLIDCKAGCIYLYPAQCIYTSDKRGGLVYHKGVADRPEALRGLGFDRDMALLIVNRHLYRTAARGVGRNGGT